VRTVETLTLGPRFVKQMTFHEAAERTPAEAEAPSAKERRRQRCVRVLAGLGPEMYTRASLTPVRGRQPAA